MTEDVGTRIGDATDHSMRHGLRVGAEFGVDARHDHVQVGQQPIVLIKTAVLENVDFDALQATERRHDLIQVSNHMPSVDGAVQRSIHARPGVAVNDR